MTARTRLQTLVLDMASRLRAVPPLLARVTLGYVFVHSGLYKLGHLEQIIGFFTSLHMPAPGFMVRFVAAQEITFGALVGIGLLTRVAALPLVGIMVVAIATAKLPEIHTLADFLGTGEFLNILLLLWLFTAGAGDVSVDKVLVQKNATPATA